MTRRSWNHRHYCSSVPRKQTLRLRGALSQRVPVRDTGIRTGQKGMLDWGVETTELLAVLFEDGPLELF